MENPFSLNKMSFRLSVKAYCLWTLSGAPNISSETKGARETLMHCNFNIFTSLLILADVCQPGAVDRQKMVQDWKLSETIIKYVQKCYS